MIQPLFLSLLIVFNLSCAAVAPRAAPSRTQSRVDLQPCSFPSHKSELLCGKYFVYENRAAHTGRMIGLSIVVLPAVASTPLPDPVFFLAGGPGQGAAQIARAGEDSLMQELRRDRDLVFIDQRGTGDSNPLRCAVTADRASLQSRLLDIFEPEMIRDCKEKLEEKADLKSYTTSIAIHDIDEVRRALGYDQINLYGVSYGTLSALEYLRRYPERVRAALLVGVATPAAKLPLQFAQGAQRAMDRLIEDCAADPACHAAFPLLIDDLAAALRAFSNGPVSFEMNLPDKYPQTVTLSRGLFAERLRLMLYDHAAASLVPYLIHRAAQGDWLPYGKVVTRPFLAAAYSVALGAYMTITCAESVPFIETEEIRRETTGTFLGDYRTLRHQRACAEWPRADIPSDFFVPVRAAVPVLMLSGDIDPATPFEFGKAAAQQLPNSRQVVLRNAPHNYSSDCARALAVEFIGKGSVQSLNTTCNEPMRRPRFLTELPEGYR